MVSLLTAATLLGSASIPVFAETSTEVQPRGYRNNASETCPQDGTCVNNGVRPQDGTGQKLGQKGGKQGGQAMKGANNSGVRQGNAGNGPKDGTGVKRGNGGAGFNRGDCAN